MSSSTRGGGSYPTTSQGHHASAPSAGSRGLFLGHSRGTGSSFSDELVQSLENLADTGRDSEVVGLPQSERWAVNQ